MRVVWVGVGSKPGQFWKLNSLGIFLARPNRTSRFRFPGSSPLLSSKRTVSTRLQPQISIYMHKFKIFCKIGIPKVWKYESLSRQQVNIRKSNRLLPRYLSQAHQDTLAMVLQMKERCSISRHAPVLGEKYNALVPSFGGQNFGKN